MLEADNACENGHVDRWLDDNSCCMSNGLAQLPRQDYVEIIGSQREIVLVKRSCASASASGLSWWLLMKR